MNVRCQSGSHISDTISASDLGLDCWLDRRRAFYKVERPIVRSLKLVPYPTCFLKLGNKEPSGTNGIEGGAVAMCKHSTNEGQATLDFGSTTQADESKD